MALTALTVLECRTDGATANGGGFDSTTAAGTNLAATVATSTSPVVTSATYTFVAGDVGHWLYIKSGTNWIPGWYQIASVSAGAATLTATIGSAIMHASSTVPDWTLNLAAGCASVASPTSGTWLLDYSQASAAKVVIDGATITAVVSATTTILTITGYTPVVADTGNFLRIGGGTATAGHYRITAITSTTITLDRSAGTAAQTATGNIGGAIASIGGFSSFIHATGVTMWAKSGTYTLTTSTAGPGGPFSVSAYVVRLRIEGYGTLRGDQAATPLMDAGAITGITLVTLAVSGATTGQTVVNINVDGKSQTGNNGFNLNDADNTAEGCGSVNCNQAATNYGFRSGTISACRATSCWLGGTLISNMDSCEAISCTADGWSGGASSLSWSDSIARGCGGDGFVNTAAAMSYSNLTSDGNAGDGYDGASGRMVDCIATNNGGVAVRTSGQLVAIRLTTFANTGARTSGTVIESRPIVLTADPYVSRGTGDLRPNTTAGGGALLRGASPGPPSQINNRDIGAVQHTDPAVGSGVITGRGMHGGMRQ